MRALFLLVLLLLAGLAHAQAQEAATTPPSRAELQARIKEVLEAPEFQTEETRRGWVWRGSIDEREARTPTFWAGFLKALARFIKFFAQVLEVLLWAGAVLVLILIYVYRDRWLHLVVRARSKPARTAHGQIAGLDIRPESLPEDVASAARAAWARGDATGALSLLYRGALSHLVNAHHLDVRSSATENDCVRIVGASQARPLAAYFESLTSVWQGLAYGGRRPAEAAAAALIGAYDAHFGRNAP
jgi:hypothetical protein